MSMTDMIAGLPFLSKQEVLMRVSADIGKAKESKRTFDLVVSLANSLVESGSERPPKDLMEKAESTRKRLEADLILLRSIVHHLTYTPEKVDA